MASTYLYRTTGTATNADKFTFSAWVKMSAVSTTSTIISQYTDGNNRSEFGFISNGKLRWEFLLSGSVKASFETNRLFRDTSAWYHFVLAYDSTDGTAGDRFKLYVNGVRETSFSSSTNPDQNQDSRWQTSGLTLNIGQRGGGSQYFNGYMNHVAFVDGTALTPSNFGQTDTTSGIWKWKSPSGVTWGDNGFHLKFDNSANLGLDSSGETNNFTLSGNGRQAKDTPAIVSATWNSLAQTLSGISYSNGNTVATMTSDAGQRESISTLGMDTGKFYMECKLQAIGSTGGSYPYVGIVAQEKYDADTYIGGNGCGWHPTGDIYNAGVNSSTGSTYTTGDIIGVAVDVTNSKLYWHKNGTYITIGGNVQNPSSGTYGFNISARTAEGTLGFGVSSWNNNGIWQVNYGNGYFGTTAISSAGSNGNGSLFEYDVPSGYYALNTKNINTYG